MIRHPHWLTRLRWWSTFKGAPIEGGIKLSNEQEAMYDLLEHSREHVFVTGKAGTGKSVLLATFADLSSKTVVKVAPTGIAALNIRGQTIHSFFHLPIGVIDTKKLVINNQTRQLLRSVDTIIIDEISMVRSDTIDAIDHVLRKARNKPFAFGGAQIIMFGDVYQLPPVVESAELRAYFAKYFGGAYFFNARVWTEANLSTYELKTVFRQKNDKFRSILDAIRGGDSDPSVLDSLKGRIVDPDKALPKNVITLTSTNASSRAINNSRMKGLKGKQKIYHALVAGDITENLFPADGHLTLAVGAQVVFLKNDSDRRWVNGTIGIVKSVSKHHVKVKCGKKIYKVSPVEWVKYAYTFNQDTNDVIQEPAASFTQIPLKLAWAITIHKSQGCTYSKVAVDLGDGAFAHGQTYVALSRCRSLSGLYLLSEIKSTDIIVEPAVVEFMRSALNST